MKRRKRIAFQGEPGANSHIACNGAYPTYEPLPCPTFEDAFAAVRSGRADLAMIPIDNSVAGRVADIHHLMPRSGLSIVGEWFLPVQHQLMAPKGATLRTIKTVESHVHALGQCRNIIRALRVKAIVAADTAGAAREVAEAKDVTRAALATKLAAKIYRLNILKKDVADAKHNTTRFVILARKPKWAGRKERLVMTTFVFQVRNIPAALYKALGGFATNGINMTKLESYMVDGSFAATQFYADVQGHPKDRGLELALEELAFVSQPKSLKILGVYPGHRFRETFK
jgi:prephenate dehydratase